MRLRGLWSVRAEHRRITEQCRVAVHLFLFFPLVIFGPLHSDWHGPGNWWDLRTRSQTMLPASCHHDTQPTPGFHPALQITCRCWNTPGLRPSRYEPTCQKWSWTLDPFRLYSERANAHLYTQCREQRECRKIQRESEGKKTGGVNERAKET